MVKRLKLYSSFNKKLYNHVFELVPLKLIQLKLNWTLKDLSTKSQRMLHSQCDSGMRFMISSDSSYFIK